jgi:nucleoside-diphosphate-sugar epimerase
MPDHRGHDQPLASGDTVIVVGGTGLIGPPLARALAAIGLDVVVVSRNPAAEGVLPGSARHICTDRSELPTLIETWDKIPVLGVVDVIAEQPGEVSPLLEAAAPFPGRTVIIGSAAVLGPRPRGVLHAEDVEPAPASGDMRAKLAIERLAQDHHRAGRATVDLRCSYPYGPGHGPMTPLGRDVGLFSKLARHDPITWVEEDDLAPIQPLWAPDLAAAIAALITRPAKPAALYHVAGPEIVSWDEYLRLLAAGAWPQERLRRVPVTTLIDRHPEAWWLRDHLRTAPLLDDSRMRREVFACTTRLTDAVGRWASWCRSFDHAAPRC